MGERLRLRQQRFDLHELELRARAHFEAALEDAIRLLARAERAVCDFEAPIEARAATASYRAT